MFPRSKLVAAKAVLILLLCPTVVLSATWNYQGYGGWRTADNNGNPVLADQGYVRFNLDISGCMQACELDKPCKGVEYISDPNGWSEQDQWVTRKCEVHYDTYKLCDTSGGGRGSTQDGCWVKTPNLAPVSINDTGITKCGNAISNTEACPLAAYPQQDADKGRDSVPYYQQLRNDRGFYYDKVADNGSILDANSPTWSCVKDNVTGLWWEGKTDDSGIHDKDWTYAWYMPNDPSGTDGHQGDSLTCQGISPCNTQALITKANTDHWCGRSDWRLPSIDELYGLVDFDVTSAPMIDSKYFPNTADKFHWSATTAAIQSPSTLIPPLKHAWGVGFFQGYSGASRKVTDTNEPNPKHVRLVSGDRKL